MHFDIDWQDDYAGRMYCVLLAKVRLIPTHTDSLAITIVLQHSPALSERSDLLLRRSVDVSNEYLQSRL